MRSFKLDIVSPDGAIFSGEAERLLARTTDGDVEILAGHTDLLSALGTGRARIRTADGKDVYFIWQNINEAESTMFVKVNFGAIAALSVMPFWPVILPFVNMFAILVLLVSVIL